MSGPTVRNPDMHAQLHRWNARCSHLLLRHASLPESRLNRQNQADNRRIGHATHAHVRA